MAMVGALLIVPSASTAAPSHAQVTGTGTITPGDGFGVPTVHVNAKNTDGVSQGTFSISYTDGTLVTGTVTCLVVAGNVAEVTGLITESSGPRADIFPVGDYIIIGIQDNGEPGVNRDLLNFSAGIPANPGCGAIAPTFPLTAGNYKVFD